MQTFNFIQVQHGAAVLVSGDDSTGQRPGLEQCPTIGHFHSLLNQCDVNFLNLFSPDIQSLYKVLPCQG